MITRLLVAGMAIVSGPALPAGPAPAPAAAGGSKTAAVPVTVENFIRAESDMYFAAAVKEGGFGRFSHRRTLMPIEKQVVVRSNRDTLYSSGVFDLEAAPVTVTMPDAGDRFMSLAAINEDHEALSVDYGAGSRTFTRRKAGTRYVLLAVRTLLDPNDPKDVARAHALQDGIQLAQETRGRFEVPRWDAASQKKVREALVALGATIPDFRNTFGRKEDVDPVRRLIGTAAAWGGNPDKDAVYLNVTPKKNDGVTVHRVTVVDVPVDAFWSISVYNARGFFEPNPRGAFTINDLTAKKNPDGSVVVQFGGCGGGTANCLPIAPGWNYTVRLYRPRAEILNGAWTFPEAQPVARSAAAPPAGAHQAKTAAGGLGGTSWRLVRFRGSDDATVAPDNPAKYAIQFNADGTLSARIDCNRGRGSWMSSGPGRVQFGQLALTRAMCPPGSMHDRVVKDWLYVRSYVLRDGHLFLSLQADGGTYEFEPA